MLSMIVAISSNKQIGLDGKMPWSIPEDLAYFKKITTRHTVIMGRKTFESIGHALPHRRNIVLTRDSHFFAKDVMVLHHIEDVLKLCNTTEEVFIIGGGEIYSLLIPYVQRLYITLIPQVVAGDTCFPDYESEFRLLQSTPGHTCLDGNTPILFTIWERFTKD